MAGVIFNIQRYSIHDGPGIRTTVFLKGCPLSCKWCHNPEGLSAAPEILVVADRCIGCGACMEACPSPPPVSPPSALCRKLSILSGPGGTDGGSSAGRSSAGDRTPPRVTRRGGLGRQAQNRSERHPLQGTWSAGKHRNDCLRCGACAEACYSGARKLVGRTVTVGEVIEEVQRDRPFYKESGGGVTFSGGEPLMQGEFLLACLKECRALGLHTAVDTCGYADPELLLEIAGSANLFLFDLKVLDEGKHRELTGAQVGPILSNLRALDAAGAEISIRFPLIPGVTDGRDNLEAIGKFVASLERTRTIQVLPFHRTASDKYARMGRPWGYSTAGHVPQEIVEDASAILSGFHLQVLTDGRIYDGKS